ncbi:Xaa-Pro dipeptidase [Candidatus Kaiserbacteria bacterium]|nr:Xaa-Pro dipeptidase [Candidatus Kaiserbacteria bacterium]
MEATRHLELYPDHLRVLQSAAEEALSDSGFGSLIIHSGTPLTYFLDDQEAPFRSNPSFAHFLPLGGPHHLLSIRAGAKPLLIILTPEDYWREHAGEKDSFWRNEFEVREVKTPEDGWNELPRVQNAGYLGDNPKEAEAHGIGASAVNHPCITAHLDWRRSFKTPYEIACIEEANHLAEHAHEAARGAFFAGASELEIHEAYLEQLAHTENDLPYGTIVALNEKSAILHYQGKRLVEDGMNLLIDAGAFCHGYASDITRTYAVESCDVLFRGLLGGVEKLQQELCAMALPGTAFPDLHHAAHVKIGNLLRMLGVTTLDGEEAAELGITRTFFPHGLGHFLGIQVHDVGGNQKSKEGGTIEPPERYPKLRMTRTIEEEMVFTIEPGIYFIPMLLGKHRGGETAKYFNWQLIDRLTPLGGIRIEDDVLATKEGNRNLTREFLA